MAKDTKPLPSRRRYPVPLSDDEREAVDRYRRQAEVIPSQASALRQLILLGLEAAGIPLRKRAPRSKP